MEGRSIKSIIHNTVTLRWSQSSHITKIIMSFSCYSSWSLGSDGVKMLSLSISVTALWEDFFNPLPVRKPWYKKEVSVLFGKGNCNTMTKAHQPEMCSWISNLRVQFQSAARINVFQLGWERVRYQIMPVTVGHATEKAISTIYMSF